MSEAKIQEWVEEIQSRWNQVPSFEVDPQKFQHLAIICDGNRRAARERGLPEFLGHQAGAETILGIAQAGRHWGIKTLTFWVWSTENWEREQQQVDFIFDLSRQVIQDEEFISLLHTDQVRFKHLGRKDRLPNDISRNITMIENQTAGFNKYRLNLGVDYGGLDEIVRAMQKMAVGVSNDSVSMEEILIHPEMVDRYLDTAGQSLVDLVVRTGVRSNSIHHLSGFMPLQTRQAGLAFLPDLFPNLTPQAFLQSLRDYQNFEQRFGR